MTPQQQAALEGLVNRALTEAEITSINDHLAAGNMSGIAEVLSVGRVQVIEPCLVGDGVVSTALGFPAGPVFVYSLEKAANAALPEGHTAEQLVQAAMVRQAWRLLDQGKLNVGLVETRAGIDALVGVLPGLDAAGAAAVKGLAERPWPIHHSDVSVALEGAV